MKIRQADNSQTQFWVSSESDGDKEYLVDVGVIPLGHNKHGHMVYNGACLATATPDEHVEHGCASFIYNCDTSKALRNPANMGKAFRCKHIKAAREHCSEFSLDGFIAGLVHLNPNLPDSNLP